MSYLKKYFKPTSLTWWASLAQLGFGISTFNVEAILLGLTGIGIRAAIK